MIAFNLKISIIAILLVITSCKPNYDKIFNENNDSFELKRDNLNHLITEIEKNFIANWDNQNELILLVDSLSGDTKNISHDLGIGSIEINSNTNDSCDKNYKIILNVIDNWNIKTLKLVQLIYDPCDNYTKKNYHNFDGYHRDLWGQGDKWFIYSDTDFI